MKLKLKTLKLQEMVSVDEELKVPSKCDVIITKQWYGDLINI